MDPQLLQALRALADASRLRLVGLLAGRRMAVEELAAASGLSAGTVVHHLKRLEAAGLVEAKPRRPYVEYVLRVDRLQAVSGQLAALDRTDEAGAELPGPEGEPLPAYDAKVLRAFLRNGKLVAIPAQEKKRGAVLRYLLEHCFAQDRTYPEPEVNDRLAAYHEDVAALRRYLVSAGLMTRTGGEYRRAQTGREDPGRRAVGTEPHRLPLQGTPLIRLGRDNTKPGMLLAAGCEPQRRVRKANPPPVSLTRTGCAWNGTAPAPRAA